MCCKLLGNNFFEIQIEKELSGFLKLIDEEIEEHTEVSNKTVLKLKTFFKKYNKKNLNVNSLLESI